MSLIDTCPDAEELRHIVGQSLEDDQADEVVVIDLTGKTSIGDFMVVCSGRSTRHVAAIAQHLIDKLKLAGVPAVRVEGLRNCDWVLVDAGDIIIHVFRPEVRNFYNIEKMWNVDQPGMGQVLRLSA